MKSTACFWPNPRFYFFTSLTVLLITVQRSTGALSAVDPNGCTISLINVTNANAQNGIEVKNLTTADVCIQFCINLVEKPACDAVEFDHSNSSNFGCWVHRNLPNGTELFDAGPTVMHYRVIRGYCPSPSANPSTMGPGSLDTGTMDFGNMATDSMDTVAMEMTTKKTNASRTTTPKKEENEMTTGMEEYVDHTNEEPPKGTTTTLKPPVSTPATPKPSASPVEGETGGMEHNTGMVGEMTTYIEEHEATEGKTEGMMEDTTMGVKTSTTMKASSTTTLAPTTTTTVAAPSSTTMKGLGCKTFASIGFWSLCLAVMSSLVLSS